MHDPLVIAFHIKHPDITIWHREPGGKDAGEVCNQLTSNWKLHVHHWHIQVRAFQQWRRRLLTRCTWCGGRHHSSDPVNFRCGDNPGPPWWKGEVNLYHRDCSAYVTARTCCICKEPQTPDGSQFGNCSVCGKFATGTVTDTNRGRRLELLASVPVGHRDAGVWAEVERLAREER